MERISRDSRSVKLGPADCDSRNGYLWWTCTFTTPSYSGCCRVDPCQQIPVGCPASAEQPVTTAPATVTKAFSSSTTTTEEPSTSSKPTGDISADSSLLPSTASPTISSTSSPDGDNSGHGITISVSALAGIVVGCTIAAIFVALSLFMWWARRKREKREKKELARLDSSRSPGDERVPPGLESVFNPMSQAGPGSVFDRAEGMLPNSLEAHVGHGHPDPDFTHLGRMSKAVSMIGSHLSGGGYSSWTNSLTPATTMVTGPGYMPGGPVLTPSPSELDGTPVYVTHGGTPEPLRGPTELECPGQSVLRYEEGYETRATLNSTEEERQSGTYANSWTRFQNIQV